ncbi:MAG: hypothetical protein KDD62_03645, partial [Bdellovibrionales bacterium]|nr:hypothetical protein [Bdellovibrionales bacterium]
QRLLDSDYLDELVQDKRAERQLSKLNETSRAQPRKEYFEDDARFSLGLPKLFNNDPSQNQIQAPDELTWKFLQSKPIKRRFAGMHVDA